MPDTSAVDLGGFVEVLRNALQTGEPQDHAAARAPEALQYQPRLGPLRRAEPAWRIPVEPGGEGRFPDGVQQAAVSVAIEDPCPEHGAGNDRHDGWQVEEGAVETH